MVPVRVAGGGAGLPTVVWRWEPETDILSGTLQPTARGASGTVEVSDAEGAVAVLDLVNGEIRGLDIVVWPDVITVPGLLKPAPVEAGRVLLPADGPVAEASDVQVEAQLSVAVDPSEQVVHFRVGPRRPVRLVQVADHLAIEVDTTLHLAGFWLTGVPPFDNEE